MRFPRWSVKGAIIAFLSFFLFSFLMLLIVKHNYTIPPHEHRLSSAIQRDVRMMLTTAPNISLRCSGHPHPPQAQLLGDVRGVHVGSNVQGWCYESFRETCTDFGCVAAATSAGEITAAARVGSPSTASYKYALTILLQPHQSLPDMTRPLCSAQRV